MARNLDIVLFGATGFTGEHVIPFLFKFTKNPKLKWGISGRSEPKLKELLNRYEKKIGASLSGVPVIVADVQDPESLHQMARQTKLIINCCGPFTFFGESVVKAAVEEGTHYIDVSGEAYYMEKMQLKYHEQAREKGVYIISGCGFDSIPADVGITFLEKNFNGTLNSVESYLDMWEEGTSSTLVSFNYGTWQSFICMFSLAKELDKIRKQLFPKKLPDFKPKLLLKFYPHRNEKLNSWILPMLGPDRPVTARTQRYFYENESKRPVQVETYHMVRSFWTILVLTLFGAVFLVLSQFQFGRKLLLKYPKIFSGGFTDTKPPSEESVEKGRFRFNLCGKGWKETLPGANHEFSTPPNKTMWVTVTGTNPGYGATCICLAFAAITVITETKKLPPAGGVYPPGYAFAKTSLTDRLTENGVEFKVCNM